MYNVVKTSDYVAVVRCSECKNRDTIDCPLCDSDEWSNSHRMFDEEFCGSDDWFCANGEREYNAELT